MNRVLNAKLTYEDYATAPADGKIYQIIDGVLLATPAPNAFHQRASKRLQRQLENGAELTGGLRKFLRLQSRLNEVAAQAATSHSRSRWPTLRVAA